MRFLTLICILLPYALLCFLKGHAFWEVNGFERGRDTFYWTESAMHLYLTKKVANGEATSGIDQRAQYPEGLDLSRDITMGMPKTIGTLYRVLAPNVSLEEFVAQFQIYFSSLSAIAVFLITLQMYGSASVAFLAALLYAVATAASARSAGAYIYEDFALPLILFAFYFLIAGIQKGKTTATVLAALLMSAALVSWHFTQFILLAAGCALGLLAIKPGFNREQGRQIGIFTLIILIASFADPLLRADGIYVSPALSFLVAIVVYVLLPTTHRWTKAAAAFVCVVMFFAIYSQLGLKDESHVFNIFLEKLKFGLIKPADPALLSFETRAMWIEDDNSPNLYSILYIGSFYLPLGILGMLRMARQQWPRPKVLNAFMLLMSLGFLVIYVMARRFLSVEIIFLCMMMGSLTVWGSQTKNRIAMLLLCMLAVFEGVKTFGYGGNGRLDAWANSLSTRQDPVFTTFGDQTDIIDWVNSQTQTDDPILTAIGLSPVLLARTNRPIILHSKFEAHGLRDKFEKFIRALFSSEDEFFTYFKNNGAKYFIYESKTALFDQADSYRYLANQLQLNENSIAYKMHFRPDTLNHFQLVYENPGYRVYRERTALPAVSRPQLLIYDENAIKTHGNQNVLAAFFRGREAMREGFVLAEQQKYSEALKIWTELAKSQPSYPEIHSYICFAHMALKDYKAAKSECELELKLNPHSRTGRFHMGLFYEQTGDIAQAKLYYNLALLLYPRYPAVLKRLKDL